MQTHRLRADQPKRPFGRDMNKIGLKIINDAAQLRFRDQKIQA